MVASSSSVKIELDRLFVKLKQLKTIEQAAWDLLHQESGDQAVAAYVAVSSQILEIELKLAEQHEIFGK